MSLGTLYIDTQPLTIYEVRFTKGRMVLIASGRSERTYRTRRRPTVTLVGNDGITIVRAETTQKPRQVIAGDWLDLEQPIELGWP